MAVATSDISSPEHLPRRVRVEKIIESRYADGKRPLSWDERVEGKDKIQTDDSEQITVFSDGGQSPPQPGWEILLTSKEDDAFRWTLYGLPKADA